MAKFTPVRRARRRPPTTPPRGPIGLQRRVERSVASRRPKAYTINDTFKKCLWRGPEEDGITYSLLCRFLTCRERFRLRVVEGLKEQMNFEPAMQYGNIWHEAEEAIASGKSWKAAMENQREKLLDEFPGNDDAIYRWYRIATMQFPLYLDYWKQDNNRFTYLLQEKPFSILYKLPSGRFIRLRGKLDAAFNSSRSIYIQENKTKGRIDEEALRRTVDQNLQTMFYHIATRQVISGKLDDYHEPWKKLQERVKKGSILEGTLYNVIRRPLADKFCIKQKKQESETGFLKRLSAVIAEQQTYFFNRWQATISEGQITRFRHEVFDPILESVLDWWDSIKDNPFKPHQGGFNKHHFRSPFGVYNAMASGFRGDFFEYLTGGSKDNLITVESLFPELDNP